MDVIRDCLDKQLVDKHGRPMGRVDGLVMEWERGRQPQLIYVEVGAVAQWRRTHALLARLVDRAHDWIGVVRKDPYQIPWAKVVSSGIEVTADVEAEKTSALEWELWLRKKIIMKIPGA